MISISNYSLSLLAQLKDWSKTMRGSSPETTSSQCKEKVAHNRPPQSPLSCGSFVHLVSPLGLEQNTAEEDALFFQQFQVDENRKEFEGRVRPHANQVLMYE